MYISVHLHQFTTSISYRIGGCLSCLIAIPLHVPIGVKTIGGSDEVFVNQENKQPLLQQEIVMGMSQNWIPPGTNKTTQCFAASMGKVGLSSLESEGQL